MNKSRVVALATAVVLLTAYTISVAGVGEPNKDLMSMYSERVPVMVPAWEAVLIGWVNALLPGILFVLALVVAAYMRSAMARRPQIIGGRDDEEKG